MQRIWEFSNLRTAALVLASVGCLSAGCGPTNDFQAISGNVTWQGKPLAKGVITLYPKGTGGTVGTEIIDGKFSIATENGASPGKYRVEINAFRPTGKSEFDIDQKKNVAIEEQFLPAHYNTASTLEAEVVADKENSYQFELKAGK